MPIPKEILAVPRPKSTVVKERAGRWIVIKRTCKRVNGKNKSVDLGMIGEIINYEYRENRKYGRRELQVIQEREEKAEVRKAAERFRSEEFIDEKDYGNIQCLVQESISLMNELEIFFGADVSKKLYSIALLRVAYTDVRNRDLEFRYNTSYLSNIIPGLNLHEDAVSEFLLEFGKRGCDIDAYMSYRIQNASSRAMVVYGMLKDYNVRENTFCEFSRKVKRKDVKNYNLITINSIDDNEPLASYLYLENVLGVNAVHDFFERSKLKANKITWKKILDDNGVAHKVPSTILIGDKDFFSAKIFNELENSEVPYIFSIKRDNRYGMSKDLFSPLTGYNQSCIYYRKEKTGDSLWLYSYRVMNDSDDNSEVDSSSESDDSGQITFVCNVDLEPIAVYLVYQNRWPIDLFELFNSTMDLDTLNDQNNYRLYAAEFLNFLATIIASRFWQKMNRTRLKNKSVKIEDDKHELVVEANLDEKSKNETRKKAIYLSDVYCFREILMLLTKAKMRRVGYTEEWAPVLCASRISDICKVLKIKTGPDKKL